MATRLLLIFLLVSQFCYGQNPPLFNPHVNEYEGFVTELTFKEGKDWYFVNVYSTFKPKRIRFKFKDGKITIDKRYKIIFWGNHIPEELFDLFEYTSQKQWRRYKPKLVDEKDVRVRNLFGRDYLISTLPVKFEAFNYKEYDRINLPDLRSWGVFSKPIYPDMVNGNTDFLIVTKWLSSL